VPVTEAAAIVLKAAEFAAHKHRDQRRKNNLRDILGSPPDGWSLARKQEYFDWAKEVVDGVRGAHPELEQRFDALYRHGRPAE
jgi:hypothetical protein